jgi:signal transduction histidine kinase
MDRLEQLRGELSGMIVHDLRNPLMVVLTALRVLDRVPAVQEDSRCQRYLRNASVAGDELLRMIGSLLDLQKLESGEIKLQRTVFSLGDVVARVVAGSQILAEVEEVDLDAEILPEIPPVRADLDLVLRTVENLVGNAVKFTPAGGRVRARVRAATPEELSVRNLAARTGVLVEVVDSGEGIPEEDQERIFEKFGVVESRKRRVKVSTGLGLAMCKLVIVAHQGVIWVESRPGAGSRFAFILPCE